MAGSSRRGRECKTFWKFSKAGTVELGGKKKGFIVKTPITVSSGDASVMAVPCEKGLIFSYTPDFNGSFMSGKHMISRLLRRIFAEILRLQGHLG